jgi:hypothetical protein
MTSAAPATQDLRRLSRYPTTLTDLILEDGGEIRQLDLHVHKHMVCHAKRQHHQSLHVHNSHNVWQNISQSTVSDSPTPWIAWLLLQTRHKAKPLQQTMHCPAERTCSHTAYQSMHIKAIQARVCTAGRPAERTLQTAAPPVQPHSRPVSISDVSTRCMVRLPACAERRTASTWMGCVANSSALTAVRTVLSSPNTRVHNCTYRTHTIACNATLTAWKDQGLKPACATLTDSATRN